MTVNLNFLKDKQKVFWYLGNNVLIPTIALEEYIGRVKCRVPEERSAVLLTNSI